VKGTHAHSWVMCFDSELSSFEAYADAMPGNCVFLVDTFDTIEGVANAIKVGHSLREKGKEMLGVRLDSGDLAHLSIKAREMLDAAGFPDAKVFASNDLDENVIESLKRQGAQIAVWGVGTKLVTSYDQPALGGVYKLGAIRDDDGTWQFKIKLSEQPIKISNPGILQVRRFLADGVIAADVIYCEELGCPSEARAVDLLDATRSFSPPVGAETSDLLVPFFSGGERVRPQESIEGCRERATAELATLDVRSKRLLKPQTVAVGLEASLHERKAALISAARKGES
jgi:nicotinate phosphoribosyltransferase